MAMRISFPCFERRKRPEPQGRGEVGRVQERFEELTRRTSFCRQISSRHVAFLHGSIRKALKRGVGRS